MPESEIEAILDDYPTMCEESTHREACDAAVVAARAELAELRAKAERAGPNGVRVRLAFEDWVRFNAETKRVESIYNTEEGVELSMGDFHSGTIFEATIDLDDDDRARLAEALESKATPTFRLFEADLRAAIVQALERREG